MCNIVVAAVDPVSGLLEPMMQYGFAGMSAVLISIIVWLIGKLLKLLQQTNAIIAANTEAIRGVDERTRDELKLMRDLREKILARPCIAKEE